LAGTRKTVPVFSISIFMYIQFNNNCKVSMTLFDTPLKPVIEKMFKHLGPVPLPFRPWDHPYHQANIQSIEKLEIYAKKLNIILDKSKCLIRDQLYFNHLHELYEKGKKKYPVVRTKLFKVEEIEQEKEWAEV
jgi:hypothetical protein